MSLQQNKPRVISFFAGIGGICLGFKQAGFDVVGAYEIDKYAVQTYRRNVGDWIHQADIKEMSWRDLPEATVWTFGFPCTDLSIAGRRAGMKVKCLDCTMESDYEDYLKTHTCPSCGSQNLQSSTRSGLFFEVIRLLDECATYAPRKVPKVLLAENVRGLTKYLPVLAEEYEMRGFTMHAKLFNSKYWGVPQNRPRYYVAGIHQSITTPFSFPEEQAGFIPKLSSILEPDVPEKYYIPDHKAAKIIEQATKTLPLLTLDGEATPVDLKTIREEFAIPLEREIIDLLEQPPVAIETVRSVAVTECRTEEAKRIRREMRREEGRDFSPRRGKEVQCRKDGVANCLTATQGIEQYLLEERQIQVVGRLEMRGHDLIRRVYHPDGIAPTLTTMQGGHRQPKVLIAENADEGCDGELIFVGGFEEAIRLPDGKTLSRNYKQGYRVYSVDGIGAALTAQGGGLGGTSGLYLVPIYKHYRVRKLTPLECGRLQGFPMDTWEQVVSDAQAYKQFGNSVTVPLVAGIAAEILKLFVRD